MFFWFYPLITSCSCRHRTPRPLRQEMREQDSDRGGSPQSCQSPGLPGIPTVDRGSPGFNSGTGQPVIAEKRQWAGGGGAGPRPTLGEGALGDPDLSPPGSLQPVPSLSSVLSCPVSSCPVSPSPGLSRPVSVLHHRLLSENVPSFAGAPLGTILILERGSCDEGLGQTRSCFCRCGVLSLPLEILWILHLLCLW